MKSFTITAIGFIILVATMNAIEGRIRNKATESEVLNVETRIERQLQQHVGN